MSNLGLSISGRKWPVQQVARKVHTFHKIKTFVDCMELLHPGLPTDEASNSIYDYFDTTDERITLCACRLIFVINL